MKYLNKIKRRKSNKNINKIKYLYNILSTIYKYKKVM